MVKRTLALELGLAFGLGLIGACSSSSNTPAGGKGMDAGMDAPKESGGGDSASDLASSPADGAADAADAADVADATDAAVLTPAQARGQYLVNTVIGCPDCHTPTGMDGRPVPGMFLAGNPTFVSLPNGDKLGSRNLTNDATGLKNRSDAEIKAMFLDGKRPLTTTDGGAGTEALNPVMPYYVLHNMTDADADAIVAYLRTVPGVNHEIPRRGVTFDLAAPVNSLDPAKIPMPAATDPNHDSAVRGRYLAAQSGLCVECHTKHQLGADQLDTTKLFAGGEDYSDLFAGTLMIHPVSKNLTSDDTTGLGTWAVSDIVNVLKHGKAKDGTGICPPMPTADYAAMTDTDATDIANYVKSLPPITNTIVDMCVFPPMAPSDGGADSSGDATGN